MASVHTQTDIYYDVQATIIEQEDKCRVTGTTRHAYKLLSLFIGRVSCSMVFPFWRRMLDLLNLFDKSEKIIKKHEQLIDACLTYISENMFIPKSSINP